MDPAMTPAPVVAPALIMATMGKMMIKQTHR